jgi:ferredoxin
MNIKNALIDIFCRIIQRIQISRKFKLAKVVNQDKCTYCGRCESACPSRFNAIQVDEYNRISIDAERCNGCGRCKRVCKEQVIEIFSQEYEKAIFQSKCTENNSKVKA